MQPALRSCLHHELCSQPLSTVPPCPRRPGHMVLLCIRSNTLADRARAGRPLPTAACPLPCLLNIHRGSGKEPPPTRWPLPPSSRGRTLGRMERHRGHLGNPCPGPAEGVEGPALHSRLGFPHPRVQKKETESEEGGWDSTASHSGLGARPEPLLQGELKGPGSPSTGRGATSPGGPLQPSRPGAQGLRAGFRQGGRRPAAGHWVTLPPPGKAVSSPAPGARGSAGPASQGHG